MLEKLWNDIRLIYDGLNFSGSFCFLINDLMIMSQDNHYLLYYKHDDITTQIRIEKNYNLVSMWSDSREVDMTDYKLYVEVDSKIEVDENYKIELTYKIITPFLREVKLGKIIN